MSDTANLVTTITTGAANLQNIVLSALLQMVWTIFDYAIMRAFMLPIVAGILAFVAVWGIERKNLQGKETFENEQEALQKTSTYLSRDEKSAR